MKLLSFFKGIFTKSQPVKEVVKEELGNVSSKYTKISTNELCAALEKEGFVLSKIQQGKSRTGTHVVRMQHSQEINLNGDICKPEIVIINSFDAKSSFKVKLGVFRYICSNGLTIGTTWGEFKVRHIGTADQIAKQITLEFADRIPQIIETVEKMQETTLTEEQAVEFALKAAQTRWEKEFTPEQAKQLLKAARPEDGGFGLWEVFNRVQENVLNGTKVEGVRSSNKAIKAPKRYENINAEIFQSAFEFVN